MPQTTIDLLEPDEARGVWSTAYVNNLPDSNFAYVEDGEKDGEGKTTPRSKRHLPYKDADGKVDLPHLRNALARLPQTDIPAEAKAAAEKKLNAAAKANDVGEAAEEEERARMSEKTTEKAPALAEKEAAGEEEEEPEEETDNEEDRADEPDEERAQDGEDDGLDEGLGASPEEIRAQIAALMQFDVFRETMIEMLAPEIQAHAQKNATPAPAPETVPEPAASEPTQAIPTTRSAETVPLKPVTKSSLYIPLTRINRERREIEGVVSDEGIDTFGTVFAYPAMRRAIEKRWNRNVREQHDRNKAVGRGISATFDDDSKTTIVRARISLGAQDTWEKILDGTLNGFSVGISNAKTETRMIDGKPTLTYVDFDLPEISVVDAPANPGAAKSGLMIYRSVDGGADMFSSVLEDDDETPAPAGSIPETPPPTPAPVAATAQTATQRTAVPNAYAPRSADDRILTDRALDAITSERLSDAEIMALAGIDNLESLVPVGKTAPERARTPEVTRSDLQDAGTPDQETPVDLGAIESALNAEHGAITAHVHTHAHKPGDAHGGVGHGHHHTHDASHGGDTHGHPHMHTHSTTGEGTAPHVHLHDHGHEYRVAAPDVTRFGSALSDVFIPEDRQDLVKAACAKYGVQYPDVTRDDGQIPQRTFDGQQVILVCPNCQQNAGMGNTCPACGYVLVESDAIPQTLEETAEEPRATQAQTDATQAPTETRAGNRLSGETRTGVHNAISQLAHTCAGKSGKECPHCAAILKVLDPDNDGDDDLDEDLNPDEAADMGNRVQAAQITRAIERSVQSGIERLLLPVVQRLNTVSARFAATRDADSVTRQLSELQALLKVVEGTVTEIAESERPGAPVVRAVDFQLPTQGPRPSKTPFTEDQLALLRQLNLAQQSSPQTQVSLAEEVFRRAQQ